MFRIQPVEPSAATGEARQLLETARSQLGAVPNFLRILAHSPKALGAFLGMYSSLGAGALDHATRERIALAVAEGNACEYCVSAHTAIGRSAGLSNEEMMLNRQGSSGDQEAAAAVALAKALNEHRGELTGAEFEAARAAGLSDAEIVEVIAAVALNFFTNVIGKATRVEIDFPKVPLLRPHRAAA
jgi:uncharacterized peroxidase-related enzyme